MGKVRHLRPARKRVSEPTVRELRRLLDSALKAEIVGLAYAALSQTDYTVNAVGEVDRRLTLARGILKDLDELLRDRKQRR